MYAPASLCTPNATNPVQSICTGFDWEADNVTNPSITPENIAQRAQIFVDICKMRSSYYHNKLLLPFGNDFRFQDADIEFTNMDMLMNYINNNQSYGVQIRYSTAIEYFDAVMKNSSVPEPSLAAEDTNGTFPVLGVSDYLPYTLCYASDWVNYTTCANFWTGYFTSYPELKRYTRERDQLLRVGELTYSIARASARNVTIPNWDKMFDRINILREASAVLNHHDAITGTAKTDVRADYVNMLSNGTVATEKSIEDAMGFLLATTRPVHVSTSSKALFEGLDGSSTSSITLVNPLAWSRDEVVKIPCPREDVVVYDATGALVLSQVLLDISGGDARTWHLYFQAEVPALGYATYYLRTASSSLEHTLRTVSVPEKVRGQQDMFLENDQVRLRFVSSPGNVFTLAGMTNKLEGQDFEVTQQLLTYPGLVDDMYRFRPAAPASPYVPEMGQTYFATGPLVQEVTVVYSANVSQTFRLYVSGSTPTQAYFEVEHHAAVAEAREMISRYAVSNITNLGRAYTDNGMEMRTRTRRVYFNDTATWSMISGQYYPVVTTASIRDEPTSASGAGPQFTIFTKQPMGGSSQEDGSLEVMLQRRGTFKHWSLNETLNDTSTAHVSCRVMLASKKLSENVRPQTSLEFNNPLYPVYGYPQNGTVRDVSRGIVSTYSSLSKMFPPNVHLLSMKALAPDSPYTILRLQHIYAQGQDQILSQSVSLQMDTYMQKFNLTNPYETSLTGTISLQEDTSRELTSWNVRLDPLQMRTYIVALDPI
eukprot:TRINITY_DN7037_c0_g1_i1.p1 TRINITY_DN7037_c0_g1~~TRINITY_DN7037_c0_g1_i1.p1  ORF type:complete len:810 (-),score=203.62 TRINITY_DN7037_c0_g1_i1:79-2379(-)